MRFKANKEKLRRKIWNEESTCFEIFYSVGTIIAWPVSSNPKDAGKWLECNGQAVSQARYPKLYAVIGAKTPDYRGLFLRGYGSNADTNPQTGGKYSSGSLMQVVHANTGKYTGTMQFDMQLHNLAEHDREMNVGWGAAGTGHGGYYYKTLSPNITIGTGETRPGNMAVRYLIRAAD